MLFAIDLALRIARRRLEKSVFDILEKTGGDGQLFFQDAENPRQHIVGDLEIFIVPLKEPCFELSEIGEPGFFPG